MVMKDYPANQPIDPTAVQIRVKCIECGHVEVLTVEQIREAQEMGCAYCSKCGFAAVVESITVKD
jgi:predicted RNA-binding Zn-ribbon protein involved in translation (DUF1610 family)